VQVEWQQRKCGSSQKTKSVCILVSESSSHVGAFKPSNLIVNEEPEQHVFEKDSFLALLEASVGFKELARIQKP